MGPDIDLIDPREEHQFYGGEKFDYNGFYNDLESDPLLLLLREANTSATPFVTLETPEYERWEGFIKSPSSFSSSSGVIRKRCVMIEQSSAKARHAYAERRLT